MDNASILSKANKKKTKDAIEKAQVWINANSNAKFDELMSKMEELESVLNPIVLNNKVARDTRKRMKENMISKLSALAGDVSGMASTVACILSDILEYTIPSITMSIHSWISEHKLASLGSHLLDGLALFINNDFQKKER
ncbi:heat shock cognate 70 kDa protein 2 [Senna tora]|uniref:Heat shock cognate 70 kDa protein 2 n=1 Tax=Senna tora TaxID=362788 RepID=A0A835CJV4_9FABA|nr:heat shock cognate 70 kDa protein 2 [Senna tora]